jgi:outer membrane scaffolding protein for murein synthesis (MipA/OmpV family)
VFVVEYGLKRHTHTRACTHALARARENLEVSFSAFAGEREYVEKSKAYGFVCTLNLFYYGFWSMFAEGCSVRGKADRCKPTLPNVMKEWSYSCTSLL